MPAGAPRCSLVYVLKDSRRRGEYGYFSLPVLVQDSTSEDLTDARSIVDLGVIASEAFVATLAELVSQTQAGRVGPSANAGLNKVYGQLGRST